MNDRYQETQRPRLGTGQQTAAISTVAPAYVMQADTEQGYLHIAQRLATAGMLPKGYDSPEKAAIAMMAGREFGISALQSLSGFAVINGRAVPWGVTLRGIADQLIEDEITGCLFGVNEMKHVATEEEDEGLDGTAKELAVALRKALRRRLARLGWSYDQKGGKWLASDEAAAKMPRPNYGCGYAAYKRAGRTVRVELFDSADAHQAGLLAKNDVWTKWTGRMLEAKAVTFAARALAAGVLGGLTSTVEELDDSETRPPAAPPPTSSALDDLASSARQSSPAAQVHDADFEVRHDPPPAEANEPPSDPPPAAGEHGTGTARGLYGLNGADALRSVVTRIKNAGGDPNKYHESACQKAIGQIKASRSMSPEEKHKVAIAIAELFDIDQASKQQDGQPTDAGIAASPSGASEVDF